MYFVCDLHLIFVLAVVEFNTLHGRPAVLLETFASITQALFVIVTKIILAIGDCNLLSFKNGLHCNNLHAIVALGCELCVGVAIVVGEARGA